MSRRTPRRGNTLTKKQTGRPTRLTENTADVIVHAVLEGNHITTACAAAGVSRTALYEWIDRGQAVQQALANEEPVDPDALRFADFADRLADARARAEMRAVQVIERSMQGGFVISEEPLLDLEGQPVRGDDGEILCKRTYAQPDGRLALSYLGRSRPDTWGQNPTNRIELTGAAGGPVQMEHSTDQIASLAERLALVAARRRAEDAEDGEVYEAELVDDGD